MGRPSLASRRRPEILDAVCTTIVRVGVSNTTLTRIADTAGVQPSLIRHYLGNKSEVMRAAAERALENVLAVITPHDAPAVDGDELIDRLFDDRLSAPEINQLVDQLVAESYHDADLRTQLGDTYNQFLSTVTTMLPATVPNDEREQTAFALVCIAHAAQTLDHLGVADDDSLRLARQAAALVLSRDRVDEVRAQSR